MYLKSLTMKGFKSFADPTTLEFEPGVTVVVGPNGSGKSNVVDAIAWVLGAQGPRVVRSTKMDDVIFAGTDGPNRRAPLGRAEVSVVIDNGERRLPIEFTEVTITRTLFRTGESEYAINGVPCRLLDVQELLSDTGVGRQQHVIVGQGQLGAVLESRPEERRMIIEEAAGVLKYRRRRERALRRLDAAEAALLRLQDLLREVRRQLRPLERQAASLHRHAELGEELRALRLFLAGRDLGRYDAARTSAEREIEALESRGDDAARALTAIEEEIAVQSRGTDARAAEALASLVGGFARLAERAKGLAGVIDERERSIDELAAALGSDGLAELAAARDRVVDDIAATEADAVGLGPEWDALAATEAGLVEAEVAHAERFPDGAVESTEEVARARADAAVAREALASCHADAVRRHERHDALTARTEELAAEIARLTEDAARARFARVAELGAVRAADVARAARASELAAAESDLAAAATRWRSAATRAEALEISTSGATAPVPPRAIGTLRALAGVGDDVEAALEAALGDAIDGAVVAAEDAVAAIESWRRDGVAGVALVVPTETAPRATSGELLRDRVRPEDPRARALLDALLGDAVLETGGFDAAVARARENPSLVIVTPEGDCFSPRGWRVGGGRAAAARRLAQAVAERDAAEASSARASSAVEAARTALEQATADHAVAARVLDRRDAEITGLEARHSEAMSALDAAEARRRAEAAGLTEVRAAEEAAAAVDDAARSRAEAAEAAASAARARAAEASEARAELEHRARAVGALRRDLEVRAAGLEERRRLLLARRAELDEDLETRAQARELARARRDAATERLAYTSLRDVLAATLGDLAASATAAEAARGERHASARARADRLEELAEARDAARARLDEIGADRQARAIERAEAAVRYDAAVDLLRTELGATPDEARAAPIPERGGEDAAARRDELERELASLGPVNPLAADELTELEARNAFLESQLEDVRAARRELNRVIQVVDAEIVDVFTRAFADVAHHYGELVATLFPGGSGQLVLTAPDDPLATGVEIEARPAGRNVRRLSLLSGGERSLVAVAFLFAVFRSRPSPFYVLDEVEAALDEPNLIRFLDLVDEFRHDAQLIVVSHQRRTMERADALYGVSMQAGGTSRTVSERLRDAAPAAGAAGGGQP